VLVARKRENLVFVLNRKRWSVEKQKKTSLALPPRAGNDVGKALHLETSSASRGPGRRDAVGQENRSERNSSESGASTAVVAATTLGNWSRLGSVVKDRAPENRSRTHVEGRQPTLNEGRISRRGPVSARVWYR